MEYEAPITIRLPLSMTSAAMPIAYPRIEFIEATCPGFVPDGKHLSNALRILRRLLHEFDRRSVGIPNVYHTFSDVRARC